jgi:hypothetical protein
MKYFLVLYLIVFFTACISEKKHWTKNYGCLQKKTILANMHSVEYGSLEKIL